MSQRKRIVVVTPCCNEVENIEPMFAAVRQHFAQLGERYSYRHLFIDNASTDGTRDRLRRLAAEHPQVQVILNTRNFGYVRSPYHALMAAEGDAVILISCDFQEPPELIPTFLEAWEAGEGQVIAGIKTSSEEGRLLRLFRTLYYRVLNRFSEVELLEHFMGFGLYDRQVIELLRQEHDAYPYLRGLISELGVAVKNVPYRQPLRKRGTTKITFYTLFDMAMLGFTSHSKIPLRMATMFGFALSLISFAIGMFYLIAKLIYWNDFSIGSAPVVVGLFFIGSVQLLFIGILGEYLGAIHTQVMQRPLVVEKERINL